MFTAFRQSVKALSGNMARTVLTTLGIVIGITTVILVLSAGEGFRSLINAQVDVLGSNTLFVQTRVPPTTKNRAAGSSGSGGSFSGVTITTLKQRDLDQIKKVPNVVNDYGIVTGLAFTSYRANKKSTIYYGTSAERFEIDKHTLQSGRFFTKGEDDGAAQVVILGSKLATDLFNQEDPLGKLVKVGNLNFQVIGVYNSQGGLSGGGMADEIAYLPMGTAQKKMLGIDYMSIIIIQVKDVNLSDVTISNITSILMRNHNITDAAKNDFEIQSQAQALDTFNVIFNGITILLIAIAAISLIVGGVGIMNIMYVVVTERTAEIGLKKALGAKNKDILYEFLIESVLVTVLGGIIGILLGALLGWLVSLIANANSLAWTFSVPLYAIALGFGVSAAIGIGFGVLPARSASKMDPIAALQYE